MFFEVYKSGVADMCVLKKVLIRQSIPSYHLSGHKVVSILFAILLKWEEHVSISLKQTLTR